MRAYATANGMSQPEEGRRCWTLNYAESAQFHMDTLPAIPDGVYKRLLLEQNQLPTDWSETAIAITDRGHPQYRELCANWPHSNPKGYADWFRFRMGPTFEDRRQRLAREERSNVEEIPEYRVRTPLQSSIQIFKRHRDVMFTDRPDEKPISIILTTLAAHAYQQEATIVDSLYGILARVEQFIKYRRGTVWIANPTDPAENFADRWRAHPERKAAFYEWIKRAQDDFRAIARTANREMALEHLEPRVGQNLVKMMQARQKLSPVARAKSLLADFGSRVRIVLNPSHRKEPPWRILVQGEVRIDRLIMRCNGSQSEEITRTESVLPKEAKLTFEASTDIPQPYEVFWQVVNTGQEAKAKGDLRGDFCKETVTNGRLVRKETTRYTGQHSIECFIVKNGFLAARSGQFIVNIE